MKKETFMPARSTLISHLVVLFLILTLPFALLACGDDDDDNDDNDDAADDDAADDDDSAADDDATDDDDDNDDDDEPSPDAAIQTMLDEYVHFTGEPAVSLMYQGADLETHKLVSGFADQITNRQMEPGMPFRVGSNTKPFVAAIVMQLVDEGEIDLDAAMTEYLPQYPQWSNVSVRQLLNMKSGIPDYLLDETFWLVAMVQIGQPMTPERAISFVADDEMWFEPGSACEYDNTNFMLLGMIISEVTGNSVAQELRERIVEPLGMADTYMDTTLNETDNLVHGYADAVLSGPLVGIETEIMLMIFNMLPPEMIVEGYRFDGTYLLHPSLFGAAGALVAPPESLATFARELFTGNLVSQESLDEMMVFEQCELLGGYVDYGLGVMRDDTEYGFAYGHDGLHFGYYAATYYVPEIDVTYSHLHNFVPAQALGLGPEFLETLMEPVANPPAACEAPEGFFASVPGANLNARFKGIINEAEDTDPIYGFGNVQANIENDWLPYYGVIDVAEVLGDSVQVNTIAPTTREGFDYQSAIFFLDEALIARADADGIIEFTADEPADVFLADIVFDAVTADASKICYTAVPDTTATSRMFLCEPESVSLAVGDIVKFHGAFVMERDPAKMETYLESIGRSPCECRTEAGDWVPCD
jgi:D-alanyl-D-alanine carboxypeptidase